MNPNLELWERLIAEDYPTVTDLALQTELRQRGAVDWGTGMDTPLATLYEQYMIMRELTRTYEAE